MAWRVALAGALMAGSPWLAAQGTAPGSAQPAAPQAAARVVLVSGPHGQVTLADVDMAIKDRVPPADRADFWKSKDLVGRMATGLYAQRVLAAQARAQGLDKAGEGALYMQQQQERALTELLMQARVRAAMPDDKAALAYAQSELRTNPQRYAEPEQVHVRHILLPVAAGGDEAEVKARAEALLAQLRQGADFAELAKAQSGDPGSAARGGDLGFFARGRMVRPFEEAAFALKQKGDLAGPVRSNFGFHIIELIERKPEVPGTVEKVLPLVREELLDKLNMQTRSQVWGEAEKAGTLDEDALARALQSRAQ
ncbi:MAG: peptidylprolyl isomerase [Pseudomonadota bacterium]|nr:peptidylprolyl isomerase [Pseudomonadota bacterium]